MHTYLYSNKQHQGKKNLIPQTQRWFYPPAHRAESNQSLLVGSAHPRERNFVPILQENALFVSDLDALLAALRLLEQTPVLGGGRPADGTRSEQIACLEVAPRGGVVGETLREGPEEVAAVGGSDGGGVAGFCCS